LCQHLLQGSTSPVTNTSADNEENIVFNVSIHSVVVLFSFVFRCLFSFFFRNCETWQRWSWTACKMVRWTPTWP